MADPLAMRIKEIVNATVRAELRRLVGTPLYQNGSYVNIAGLINEAAHDALDHTGLTGVPAAEAFTEAVHDLHDHAGLTGVGNAFVVREDYVDTDTIVVTHSLGVRPIVQVIGGAGPAYGVGSYGAGDYGGSIEQTVLTPSSIVHNTVNQVTVTLLSADTGEVVCIG
jgi:hypothetical protein